MNACEEDTIGGYNTFLNWQRSENRHAYITTALFDNHYEILCEHKDINEAGSLSSKEYFARGSTALLDAIGLTISRAAKRQAESTADTKTLMIIITDGLDNMSRVYSIKTIWDMIHERESHGWEFIFLGTDMDSVRTAQSLGISSERAGNFTREGICDKFRGISQTVSHFRNTGEINNDWTT